MNKYKKLNLVFLSALVFTLIAGMGFAHAEEEVSTSSETSVQVSPLPSTRMEVDKLRTDLKLEREQKAREMQDERRERKTEGEARAEVTANIGEDRAEARAEMKLRIKNTREEREENRVDAKARFDELRQEAKEGRDGAQAERLEKRVNAREKALERFDKLADKLTEMKDRVNGHIEKFEEKGVDVAASYRATLAAESKIGEISVKVVEMNAFLALSLEELTEDQKTQIKALAKEAQTLAKETHGLLRDAVRDLKASVRAKIEQSRAEREVKVDADASVNAEVN